MARKQLTEEEKNQIRNSLIETRLRRQNQVIKVFELKVNCHQTNKETFKKLKNYFIQAKWVYNDMLCLSKINEDENTDNIFDYNYLEHKTVHRFDKNKNSIEEQISLPVFLHRGIVAQTKTNITNLTKAKRKGIKVGKLKFKSEYNSIPIITGGIRLLDNSHITIPGFKNLKVYGMHQILELKDYEIADGKLLWMPSGFYIKVTVCLNKKEKKDRQPTHKEVGLDFGIKDNITTSDGEKFNCKVQESEYLKYLQKHLDKKKKYSKHYYKLINQIRKEYEHLSNKKQDETNKIIHYLKKNYDVIYFQDEQLSKWKEDSTCSKTIQHSYLGRVKAKLVSMKGTQSFMIDKWKPTTKYCPHCGKLNNISLNERTYNCECGYSMDRDIHAANNVKLFGSTQRAECLEQASDSFLAKTKDVNEKEAITL